MGCREAGWALLLGDSVFKAILPAAALGSTMCKVRDPVWLVLHFAVKYHACHTCGMRKECIKSGAQEHLATLEVDTAPFLDLLSAVDTKVENRRYSSFIPRMHSLWLLNN